MTGAAAGAAAGACDVAPPTRGSLELLRRDAGDFVESQLFGSGLGKRLAGEKHAQQGTRARSKPIELDRHRDLVTSGDWGGSAEQPHAAAGVP